MTLTISSRNPWTAAVSTPKVTVTDITFDSAYVTGGEAVTAANLGLNRVDFAIATVKSASGAGVNVANVYYNKDTAKLLAYDETPAEVANDGDISTTVVQIVAWGR
jgi:hypothetical protein